MKVYFVYILASDRNGTLYVGVTSDLARRLDEHRSKAVDSFTQKYSVSKLVYYEQTSDITSALWREKNLKSWNRKWKLDLIENFNPVWRDLADDL